MTLVLLTPTARTVGQICAPVAVTVRPERAHTVVALHGEADLSATPILCDVFAQMLANRTGDVVADMAELEFIDTSACRTLAVAHRLLTRNHRALTFRAPSPPAARLLSLFGLSGSIEPRRLNPGA